MTAGPTTTQRADPNSAREGRAARFWRARSSPWLVTLVSLVVLAAVIPGLVRIVDGASLADAWSRVTSDPAGITIAIGAFAGAFVLRGVAWVRVVPQLGLGQALAGIHVGLGANHVLPLRLGEPMRIVSVVRRSRVTAREATASTITLRSADIVVLVGFGFVVAPTTMFGLLGGWGLAAVALLAGIGGIAILTIARKRVGRVHPPDPTIIGLVAAAWLSEAAVVWQVARWFDIALTPTDAILVLAAAVSAQLVAVAPGGLGTYEAAGAAAFVAVGVPLATGFTVTLALHAVTTAYSLISGLVACVVPSPGLLGPFRLPSRSTDRQPLSPPVDRAAPVVLFLPAHNEAPRIAEVLASVPESVQGHPVVTLVVDDGSTDSTAEIARASGATVVSHPTNRGLGAAVRTGFAAGVDLGASAVAFCDADGEYDPAELDVLVTPILAGRADYVVGSRFAGNIQHMRPHRRFGNRVLTRWLAWTVRHPITDGQSGYRALSGHAAATVDIVHDYNYAQVLTVDALRRGMRYREVPITYRFRSTGRSFVRLLPYLRSVVPAVNGLVARDWARDLVGHDVSPALATGGSAATVPIPTSISTNTGARPDSGADHPWRAT
ncbi:MAG: lysylphosphatidylglycerol synthase domain-containing protein [Ilumatobacteraceae bacterium]